MSSVEIKTIYKKLVQSYVKNYPRGNPLWVLNKHINAYTGYQWKTKEPAILDIALREGIEIPKVKDLIERGKTRKEAILEVSKNMKLQVSETEVKQWLKDFGVEKPRKVRTRIDEVYKRLVEIYAYKHGGNAVKEVNLNIAMLQHGQKSTERAVLELALHLGLGIVELRAFEEDGLSKEEAISEFLKGEKLQLTEDDQEIKQIVAKGAYARYGDKTYKPSTNLHVTKGKPTLLWYLVPIIFSLLGGLIAYVGVKGEDEEMAKNLLFVGFIVFIIQFLILWFI